jgi:hypothetical protein
MAEWRRPDLARRLREAGYAVDLIDASDLGVAGVLELSFAADGALTWAELYVA